MKRSPYKVTFTISRSSGVPVVIGPLTVAEAQRAYPDWHDGIAATSRDGHTRCYACDAGNLYISRSAERA